MLLERMATEPEPSGVMLNATKGPVALEAQISGKLLQSGKQWLTSPEIVTKFSKIVTQWRSQRGTPKRGWEEKRQKKGDAKKGTGRETSENVMTNRVPFPSNPILSEAPPPAPPINVSWSTEKRETG